VIVAMSGSEAIGISGSGNIGRGTRGIVRLRTADCYYLRGEEAIKASSCNDTNYTSAPEDKREMLQYFYDTSGKVWDFLAMDGTRQFGGGSNNNDQLKFQTDEAYLMIYNSASSTGTITVKGDTPFALPQYSIEASAKNGDALQIFRFSEDKSRYYDALKYGVYNNNQE